MPMCTEKQAVEYIGRTRETLRLWRNDGLPFTMQPKAGRLYDTTNLDQYRDLMAERYRAGSGRPRKAN